MKIKIFTNSNVEVLEGWVNDFISAWNLTEDNIISMKLSTINIQDDIKYVILLTYREKQE